MHEVAFGPLATGLLIASAVGLSLFVITESRVATPLLTLSTFRDPILATGLTTSALVSTVMMTTLVVAPFHLNRSLDLNPAYVGLVMSAGPAVSALTGVPAGRATDRYGTEAMVVVGLSGVIGGSVMLSLMPTAAGVAGYILPLVAMTASYATFQAANNTAIMKDAAPHQRGLVSGMLNLSRNLGLITGASMMGAVFAAAVGTSDITTAAPDHVARGTHRTFAVAALLVTFGLAAVLGLRLRSRLSPSRSNQARSAP